MHCCPCSTYSLLRLAQKQKWWIYSLSLCMQGLWRLCCNEAVCIMHELAFERHAAPNVVIFCLPSLLCLFLPRPSSLTYCTSLLIATTLLQARPSRSHWINYCFCAALDWHWVVASGRRKGKEQYWGEGQVVARKCPEIRWFLFFLCIPVKLWAGMICALCCVCVSRRIQHQRKEKEQTRRAPVGVFTFFCSSSLVSGCSLSP